MVPHVLVVRSPPMIIHPHSLSKPKVRRTPEKAVVNCVLEPCKDITRQVIAGIAASIILFISQTSPAVGVDFPQHSSSWQLANATDNVVAPIPLDSGSDNGMVMMMKGMTAKNFDPIRYSGRWFEVASLKSGFAGQGQEVCHCTQGIYTVDVNVIQVDTFCNHGGPDGFITGIRGNVQCSSEEEKEKNESDLQKTEAVKEKCFLRYPTLLFIPKEPYDVIATDYDSYALVSGAKDKSFIQIYSRKPNPGTEFIEKYKNYLADLGYDPNKIKDTPQDCEMMSDSKLSAMMSSNGMQQALTNQFPDLELKSAFNPFTSVFDTLKKLFKM